MNTLPAVNQAGDAAETLALVCDALGIGELARSRSTILMNVENARRRSDCLWKIEHEFFMVSEPDEDEPDGPPFETCLLNWGDDPEQYVKKFGEVLAAGRVPVEFLEQIRRSCDVAGYESNDDSQEQKRWYGLRDQAARILASSQAPVALLAEPELRRILREVTAVAITQLFEAYPAATVAEFSVEELQLVSDSSRVLRAEQVEHIYRRGFDLTLAAIPSGGAGCSVNAGLDSASINALIEKYGSQAHPDEGNDFTTGDLPLVKAVIAALHVAEPVAFTTLGAATRAIRQCIQMIDQATDHESEALTAAVRRTLRGADLIAEESGETILTPNPASQQGRVNAVLASKVKAK